MKNKSNLLMTIVSIICGIGILLILFIVLFPSLKSKFSSNNFEHQFILEPGIYEVGTHIPAGTYYVNSNVEEKCYLEIYELQDGYIFTKGIYEIKKGNKLSIPAYSLKMGAAYFTLNQRLRNIDLANGELIFIKPNNTFLLYADKVDLSTMDVMQITNKNNYLASAEEDKTYKSSVSGVDFQPGVYDIIYTPTEIEDEGSIKCKLRFNGSYESEFYLSFECTEHDEEQIIYKNVPFTANSTISVSNIKEVNLVPSEITSNKIYNLTWNTQ